MEEARSRLYFECHITTEPVIGSRLELLCEIASRHHFKVADLVMLRGGAEQRSDAFMTGRHVLLSTIDTRMRAAIADMALAGFAVWRAKIEDTVLDSKCGDIIGGITSR